MKSWGQQQIVALNIPVHHEHCMQVGQSSCGLLYHRQQTCRLALYGVGFFSARRRMEQLEHGAPSHELGQNAQSRWHPTNCHDLYNIWMSKPPQHLDLVLEFRLEL